MGSPEDYPAVASQAIKTLVPHMTFPKQTTPRNTRLINAGHEWGFHKDAYRERLLGNQEKLPQISKEYLARFCITNGSLQSLGKC